MDNHLKRYRRTSQLAQNDIAFLLGMDDSSYISKIELGKRRPNLDTLVMYCLLFDTSLQDLVPEHFNVIRKKIVDGIELLLPLLQDDFSQFTEDRIQALIAIQKKLRDTPLL